MSRESGVTMSTPMEVYLKHKDRDCLFFYFTQIPVFVVTTRSTFLKNGSSERDFLLFRCTYVLYK